MPTFSDVPAVTQSSSQAELALKPEPGQKFGTRWILGNAIAHGVGFSLPIFVGDLSLTTDSVEYLAYAQYIGFALFSFGLWTGLAQWLILRQRLPVSARWIVATAVSPGLAALFTLGLASRLPPSGFAILFVLYPLILGLWQWRLLRRALQPAWTWIVTSLIAIALSTIIGLFSGTAIDLVWLPQLGISVLIGGLLYGSIYGAITFVGLRRLLRQAHAVPQAVNTSKNDLPPDTKAWKAPVLTTGMLIAVIACWIPFLPPLSPAASASLRTLPVWLPPLCIGLITLAYMYVSILIHELGHLTFALSQGYELKAFAVDRWVLVRRGKGWRMRRTRKRFAGGFVEPIPKSLKVFSRRSLMVMIAGGPVASFLLFCAGAAPLLLSRSFVSNHAIVLFLVFLSSTSLYMAIFNALPLKLGYLRTDGRRFLDVAKNNQQGQRFAALYGVNASLRQGIRPREIDPTLVERALSIPEKSMDHISGLMIAYMVAIDEGKLEQAGDYLDQALEINLHFPEIFRGMLLLEGAYFEAYIRHQAEVARGWFDKIPETAMIAPYALLKAEAALLLAEGHPAAALIKAEQGMESIRRDRFMKGDAIADEDRLTDLIQTIREHA